MVKDVYNKLATHLDKLPGGYPPTEAGVELRILKRLFSEEHAKLAIHLTLIPEPSPVVARRAKVKIGPCVEMLQEMEQKGLPGKAILEDMLKFAEQYK